MLSISEQVHHLCSVNSYSPSCKQSINFKCCHGNNNTKYDVPVCFSPAFFVFNFEKKPTLQRIKGWFSWLLNFSSLQSINDSIYHIVAERLSIALFTLGLLSLLQLELIWILFNHVYTKLDQLNPVVTLIHILTESELFRVLRAGVKVHFLNNYEYVNKYLSVVIVPGSTSRK